MKINIPEKQKKDCAINGQLCYFVGYYFVFSYFAFCFLWF